MGRQFTRDRAVLREIGRRRKLDLIKRIKYKKLLRREGRPEPVNLEGSTSRGIPLGVSLGIQGDEESLVTRSTADDGKNPSRKEGKPDPFFREKREFQEKKAREESMQRSQEAAEQRKKYYADRRAKTKLLRVNTPKGQPLMKNLVRHSLDRILKMETASNAG